MSNEVISATQIVSTIGFIFVVFGLYRLLVSRKDATIELLKEKNAFLAEQLREALESGPDALAERLIKRVKALTAELEGLNTTENQNNAVLTCKEEELRRAQAELTKLREQLERAETLVEEFCCPYCQAPMTSHEFPPESFECNGGDVEIEHEYVSYECGFVVLDGKEQRACPHKGG